MSDKVISIVGRKKEKEANSTSNRDRVENCMFSEMFGVEHENCRYCTYRHETAKMLFDILVNDTIQGVKKKNLDLTNIDIELTIAYMMKILHDFESTLEEKIEQKEQSSRGKSEGLLSQIKGGESTTKETDSTTGETPTQE